MTLEYPTEYKDRRGTEFSKFITDGESMKIVLRGIEFVGHFWELTPIAKQAENAKLLFDLNEKGELIGIMDYSIGANPPAYSLKVQVPIKIVTHERNEIDAKIDFRINPHKIDFIINGKQHEFEKPNFEYGLSHKYTSSLKISHIKCCINCKYGEYSPYGNEEYGDMMCFKSCKEAWLKVGYQGLKESGNWEKLNSRTRTQEAYWCSEFELKEE
jgi:hypothetical protein